MLLSLALPNRAEASVWCWQGSLRARRSRVKALAQPACRVAKAQEIA
jgi:hypothetical protein